MRLYNSRSAMVEPFVPMDEHKVKMYVCGPTVYNHAHVGNARPLVVFDVLARVIKANGYDLEYVSNYTDVDDKIINKAIEEGVDEHNIASRYIDAYQSLRDALNCLPLYATPKVTETMDAIIAFIDDLVKAGYAYNVEGNVYFDVTKDEQYGCVSRMKLDQLDAGNRIETSEDKRSPYDFVLWKKTDKGIQWDSPWGKGRPGWHTECVVMIQNVLGGRVDIHGGGADLRFPHHENEQAQCWCHAHHDLANYWVHNAMININGEKMSKSLGNVVLAKDVVAKLGANVFRWVILSTHYRGILNFTDEVIEGAKTEINKVYTALKQANTYLQVNHIDGSTNNGELYNHFVEVISDDLDTPNGFTTIFDGVKQLNTLLRAKEKDGQTIADLVHDLTNMLDILGIRFDLPIFDENQIKVYQQWVDAKKEKNFELADTLREQLIQWQLI